MSSGGGGLCMRCGSLSSSYVVVVSKSSGYTGWLKRIRTGQAAGLKTMHTMSILLRQ